MSTFTIIDNFDGTISKTVGERTETYRILVGKNIPTNESIVNYCYYQFEDSLQTELSKAGIPQNAFCSGTCVAMVLAITRGDSSIVPADVIYWENGESSNDKGEINGISGIGIKDWEQDKFEDGGQIERIDYSSEEEHLINIKRELSAGQPVIVHVNNHFVVIVGVESGVDMKKQHLNN